MELNLLTVEKNIIEVTKTIEDIKKEYDMKIKMNESMVATLKYQKEILMKNYNLSKIENAKRFVYTRGCKKYFRGDADKQLIKAIKDVAMGCPTLLKNYIGCKDYESYTGQSINCDYGMCPSHGSVRMEIGVTKAFRSKDIIPDDNDLSDMLYFLNLLTDEKSRDDILRDGE